MHQTESFCFYGVRPSCDLQLLIPKLSCLRQLFLADGTSLQLASLVHMKKLEYLEISFLNGITDFLLESIVRCV
uniref:Ovule protein n=1 Tax=Ditylenchus dipsaci TaxID=166011 RepID=A0A915E911_9BILA